MTKYPLILNEGFDLGCLSLNEGSSPLQLLVVSLHCLNTAFGACLQKTWSEQPTLTPQAVFPRPWGRGRGKVPCLWHAIAVSVVQLQHSQHLVVRGMEVLVLPHRSGSCSSKASNLGVDEISLYLQHIFQHFCVLNSSLSYRLLITVLKYSVFQRGFSCKDYVSVISGNKQGAGRRLFFPIIF